MKRALGFILTLSLSFSLFACGKKDKKTTKLVKDYEWVTPAQLLADYQKNNKKVSTVKMTYKFTDDDFRKYSNIKGMIIRR